MRAFLLAAGLFTVASCGGRAALEAYIGESQTGPIGSAGAGGSGGIAVSSSDGQGGAVSTTSIATAQGPVTTVTTNGVGGSSGVCDKTGDCQTCAQCAFEEPCADEWNACFAEPECEQFQDCLDKCMGGGQCFFQCQQEFPDGAATFLTAYQCILCVECVDDCEGQAPPMLCQ